MPSVKIKPNLNPVIAQHHTLIGSVELGSENCLSIGETLADFEILGVVGEGGFGIVYLAFDHSLRRTVAIKEYMPISLARRGKGCSVVLRSSKHADAFNAGLKSYINEARLLAQFDHPALVKVYRFWEENNTAYMAMQFYDGHTLKHIIENSPELISQEWLKNMLGPILAALDTLYSAQILHRDISPENIIIQKNGAPVLLDFGSARQVLSGMPQSLTVVLKPSYAPIEQYADDASMQQGPWTDIYALCAVIYKAIAKKTAPSSVTRMIQDPIESLVAGAYPGYTADFLQTIDHGLAVLPKNRPQSIAQFRSMLGIEAVEPAEPPPALMRPKIVTSRSTPNVKTVPFSLLAAAGDTPVEDEARELASRISEKRQAESEQERARAKRAERRSSSRSATYRESKGKGEKTTAGSSRERAARPRWHYAAAVVGLILTGATAFGFSRGDKAAPPVVPAEFKVAEKPALPASVPAPAILEPVSAAPVPTAPASSSPAPLITPAVLAAATTPEPKKVLIEPRPEEKPVLQEKPAAQEKPVVPKVAKAAESSNPVQETRAQAPLKLSSTLDPQETVLGAAEAVPAVGTVMLAVKPWGTLYINGVQKGVSPPVKKLKLAEGKYKVRVRNPNFPDYMTEINVTKKRPVTIQHNFGGAEKASR